MKVAPKTARATGGAKRAASRQSGNAPRNGGGKRGAPARPGAKGQGRGASPRPEARARWRPSWPEIRLSPELRRDLGAVVLVVLAALTLWSLLGGRGGLVGLWSTGLRRLFGWAAFLVPLALILVVVEIFREPPVRRRGLLGLALFAVATLGALHLPAPDPFVWVREGRGGGYLGSLIAAPLTAALRPLGAAIVLLGLAVVAVVVGLDTDLRSLGRGLTGAGARVKAWGERQLRRLRGVRPPSLVGRVKPPEPAGAVFRVARPPARPAAGVGGAAGEADEEDEDDRRPVINLPQPGRPPAGREPTATDIGLRVGERLRAALDEPTEPLVVGAGQLPLPAGAAGKGAAEPRYAMPPLAELPLYDSVRPAHDELDRKAKRIEETLGAFRIEARVREINPGAAVTQFALEPGPGVKVRSIKALENDLMLALAAASISIDTPIPGQSRVGIAIPNKNIATVGLRETMESPEFAGSKAKLPIALGRDVNGRAIVADLAGMPHLLIAGSTGSGKSVCLNSIISTFLLMLGPDELKMAMIDPKMVELVGYNGIPHLKGPVVIEMDKVVGTLRQALTEMERRYAIFSKLAVRNLEGYHARAALDPSLENMPYLVVIIDELADLMMTAPDEVETIIVRLAQKARATGIHLIIATQRPSVDVLTGLIKANFPARIAFAVTSLVDSRVILDTPGAERLLGRGDMLYQDPKAAKPVRVQGTFVDDRDIERIVRHWRTAVPEPQYEPAWTEVPKFVPGGEGDEGEGDPLLDKALEVVREHGTASASMLQRKLRVGYNRAARLIEQMEEEGIIGPSQGAGGRTVLGKPPRDEDDLIDNASIPFDDE